MLSSFSKDGRVTRPAEQEIYEKLENIVHEMLDEDGGVKPKLAKGLSCPGRSDVFAAIDIVEWLQQRFNIYFEVEACHLASMLVKFGYLFAAEGCPLMTLVRKDGSFFRFQSPMYWPSRRWEANDSDYAVYLLKKAMTRGKTGLHEGESAQLAKLFTLFDGTKLNSIMSRAEDQVRCAKEQKKLERALGEREEEVFWHVRKPMPNEPDVFDVGLKKFVRRPSTKVREARSASFLQERVDVLKESALKTRTTSSLAINNCINHCEQHREFDGLVPATQAAHSHNKWTRSSLPGSDDLSSVRVQKWAASLNELLGDPIGTRQFELFLKKEFSDENLRFWIACENLRYAQKSKVASVVNGIYRDYLAHGAPFEVNIDSKTMAQVNSEIQSPSRYTFDQAQRQIYSLMSRDSYQRFLKSEQYSTFLEKAIASEKKSSKGKGPSFSNIFSGLSNPGLLRRSSAIPPGTSNEENGKGSQGNHLGLKTQMTRSKSEADLAAAVQEEEEPEPYLSALNRGSKRFRQLFMKKKDKSKGSADTESHQPSEDTAESPVSSPVTSPVTSPLDSLTKSPLDVLSSLNLPPASKSVVEELAKRLTIVEMENEELQREENEMNEHSEGENWEKVSEDFY